MGGRSIPRIATAVSALVAVSGAPARGQDAPEDTARSDLWIRPLASLLVPGSGQLLAHQDRGVVYLGVEFYLVLRYLQLREFGMSQSEEFRRLAFEAARRSFTMVRRDTVFEYYEQMQRFTESGEFDSDPGERLIPEDDVTTYNGSVWLLARRTFWRDPNVPPDAQSLEYQQALEFYRDHAVGPDFRWSWRNAGLEQQVFGQTIRRSDTALRSARNQLGLLLANHVASAVDAFISSRLASAAQRPARVRTMLAPDGASVTFQLSF